MNRAFLVIFIPAALAAAGYFTVMSLLKLHLSWAPFLGAVGGFVAAIVIVRWYLRRKAHRPAP